MAKVRIQAKERVHFDQIVEVPEHNLERLKEALASADEAELAWIADTYLNREAVEKTGEFEVSDIFPCTNNGAKL